MLNLTQKGVEIFIKKAKNIEPFWNNYDLIIWKKDPSGFSSIKGMFRNNSWGTAKTVKVNDDGIWKLSKKYVRHFR